MSGINHSQWKFMRGKEKGRMWVKSVKEGMGGFVLCRLLPGWWDSSQWPGSHQGYEGEHYHPETFSWFILLRQRFQFIGNANH